jgi:L-seryl-tRNA(Ser) seleniumtransferase
MANLRGLPSVDHLLQTEQVQSWITTFGRPLTVDAIRNALDTARMDIKGGAQTPQPDHLLFQTKQYLDRWTLPTLQPVINATGVVLHTNLGRSPLSLATIQAIQEVALGYSNLEYDLEKGKRGSRLVHTEELLKRLTGAQAALVVNNNASAVLLALSALARRKRVIIARSQLVEIGGGFRVPDVMKQSGAKLVEVGTTNRVHRVDYEQALEEEPAAVIMRVHRSNFRLVGFTSEPSFAELADTAHSAGVIFIDDLGSGTLIDTSRFGLEHEPTVQESLSPGPGKGADLVCFSGDKLLGGPQAGIILGREDLILKLKKHPLARAIRADKLCLAGLSATLLHYLKDEADREIPVWRMISATAEQLETRVRSWVASSGKGNVISGKSTIGGGSLPGETLPTYLLAIECRFPNRYLDSLRELPKPVIARLENDQILFDPRTVLPEQDEELMESLRVIDA